MKATFSRLEEAAKLNSIAVQEFNSVIADARVRKALDDARKGKQNALKLETETRRRAESDNASINRRSMLFGGIAVAAQSGSTKSTPRSVPSMGTPRGEQPSQSKYSQTERRQAIAKHAGMMFEAKEDARIARSRILFESLGGPSAAVGDWVRQRLRSTTDDMTSRRPPSQLSCSTGAPPFSSAPCSISPRLNFPKSEAEDGLDMAEDAGFAGAGHFWHRMQKMEVDLLCNAVHLQRHRENLDDAWLAIGGKPDDLS